MNRAEMPISERAKQFMPFAALKGLEEALIQKERELTLSPRKKLSDHEEDRLDRLLRQVQKGDRITVQYYLNGEYLTVCGRISLINASQRFMLLGEDTVLPFADIYDIVIVERDTENTAARRFDRARGCSD